MIFYNNEGKLQKLNFLSIDKEKVLQKLIEENLLVTLDIDFLESEYKTTTGGRIDTLAIDSNGAPVIIEYKRNKNDNVINQSLSYLKWLKSQKIEFFEMLVMKKLGPDKVKKIDWKNPRIICIAESYNRFDIDTLEAISVNLELYKYQYYENNTFTLENIKGEEEKVWHSEQVVKNLFIPIDKPAEIGLDAHLNKTEPFVQELFFKLQDRILILDDNIQQKINNNYIGFKIAKMFAEVHLQKNKILIYLRPINYIDPDNKITKVPDTHNWVLNRRIYINNENEIDYVMNIIEQSYKDVL